MGPTKEKAVDTAYYGTKITVAENPHPVKH